MNNIKYLVLILLMVSCSTTKTINESVDLKIQAGTSHGGIIENTDMSISEALTPDAYSGATRIGFSVGARLSLPLKKNGIQTGLDVLGNKMQFNYSDATNGYTGVRDIYTTQLRIPLLYSIHIFKNNEGRPMANINAGFSPGLVFCTELEIEGIVPDYTASNFSFGPALGLEIHPIQFQNGSTLGLSFELMRSFQKNYDDFYQLGEMPAAGYIKAGLIYGF